MNLDLLSTIEMESAECQIPAQLLRAIVTVESGGDCFAWRTETKH